jgi:hypothetical protein
MKNDGHNENYLALCKEVPSLSKNWVEKQSSWWRPCDVKQSFKFKRNFWAKIIASTENFDGYQRLFAPINVSSIHFIREWVSLVYATPTSSKTGKHVSYSFGLQMYKVAQLINSLV